MFVNEEDSFWAKLGQGQRRNTGLNLPALDMNRNAGDGDYGLRDQEQRGSGEGAPELVLRQEGGQSPLRSSCC